eukprot:IDg9543t1
MISSMDCDSLPVNRRFEKMGVVVIVCAFVVLDHGGSILGIRSWDFLVGLYWHLGGLELFALATASEPFIAGISAGGWVGGSYVRLADVPIGVPLTSYDERGLERSEVGESEAGDLTVVSVFRLLSRSSRIAR